MENSGLVEQDESHLLYHTEAECKRIVTHWLIKKQGGNPFCTGLD